MLGMIGFRGFPVGRDRSARPQIYALTGTITGPAANKTAPKIAAGVNELRDKIAKNTK